MATGKDGNGNGVIETANVRAQEAPERRRDRTECFALILYGARTKVV